MLNLTVALRILGPLWENKYISIRCDNLPVFQILTTGKARDQILATCGRNIWLLTAIHYFHLTVQHIDDRDNKGTQRAQTSAKGAQFLYYHQNPPISSFYHFSILPFLTYSKNISKSVLKLSGSLDPDDSDSDQITPKIKSLVPCPI